MGIADQIPTLSDKELGALHANARRLIESDDPKQRLAAEALMPAIEAELAERQAAKPAPAAPARKRAAKKKTTPKPS